MKINRLRIIAGLSALAFGLAACSATTDGTGSTSGAPRPAAPSSPDAPSTSPAPATTGQPGPPSGPGASSSVHPVPASPLKSVTVPSRDGRTYPVRIWAEVRDRTCFDHAYGSAMISFLTQHPCNGLERVLGTTTVNGRGVGFAESSTGFPGSVSKPYLYASQFQGLERADGTGSIKDLLMDGYRLPSGPTAVPSSEAFNVLGQDDGVTVWDAWYLDGATPDNDPDLLRMTEDLFLRF